jgi:hypothetical protein
MFERFEVHIRAGDFGGADCGPFIRIHQLGVNIRYNFPCVTLDTRYALSKEPAVDRENNAFIPRNGATWRGRRHRVKFAPGGNRLHGVVHDRIPSVLSGGRTTPPAATNLPTPLMIGPAQ